MPRDLRDVVNKIIVMVNENEPTAQEIADLASDLAAFFDASVLLLYLGGPPPAIPQSEGPAGYLQVAKVMSSMEENAKRILDRMTEVMVSHGIEVTSRVVMGAGAHSIRDVIEKEKCDLVVVPNWETGAAQRLMRLFWPSVLEDATCPVLVLKGNKWLSESKAIRPGRTGHASAG